MQSPSMQALDELYCCAVCAVGSMVRFLGISKYILLSQVSYPQLHSWPPGMSGMLHGLL